MSFGFAYQVVLVCIKPTLKPYGKFHQGGWSPGDKLVSVRPAFARGFEIAQTVLRKAGSAEDRDGRFFEGPGAT